MTGRPSRIIRETGELALDRRGARMLLAALDLALRDCPPRYRGRAAHDDFSWLYEQARIVAAGSASGTSGVPVRIVMPASGAVVSTGQAAAILGVSRRAVAKQIETGRLPAQRVGREWVLSEYEVRSRATERPGGNGSKKPAGT